MSSDVSLKQVSIWLQIFSIIALALIPLIVYRTMTNPPGLVSQPQIVGLIFITICVLGSIAGVRPSSFSRQFPRILKKDEVRNSEGFDLVQHKPILRGHHYSCDLFSDHVILIGNNVFCAGCTGLTTGAVLATIGSLAYFFFNISFSSGWVQFGIGFSCVFIGLVQHQFYRILSIKTGFFRFVLNVIFVFGSFLVLVGANQITGNLTVDFYILCVILLWILNRIMMSKSEHERICLQCDDESCGHPLG
ncbi:MAG: hypothetical protein ACFFEL_03450 [Candidatus Thorarchaeota archaeon]